MMKRFGEDAGESRFKAHKKEEFPSLEAAVNTQKSGDHEKAEKMYLEIISKGHAIDAVYSNLGVIYKNTGREKMAIDMYKKALKINPLFTGALCNLGNLLIKSNEIEEALKYILKALDIEPKSYATNLNLSVIYIKKGEINKALEAAKNAIEIKPESADGYYNLGMIYRKLNKTKEAIKSILKSIDLDPAPPKRYIELGDIYGSQNDHLRQKKCYLAALRRNPNILNLHLLAQSVSAKIYNNDGEINRFRQELENTIDLIAKNPGLKFVDNMDLGLGIFWLAFQNRNDDREILEKLSQALLKNEKIASISKKYRTRISGRAQESPIHVGIITDCWEEMHSVMLHYSAIFEHLRNVDINISIVVGPSVTIECEERIKQKYRCKTYRVPPNLEASCKKINSLNLDLILYPEIGMSTHTYMLGLMRLAPVQVVMAGHPNTTGLQEIDYFISSGLMEDKDCDLNYTEQLIKFNKMPTAIHKAEAEGRSLIIPGISKDTICIGITHALFKMHHDFDEILEELALSENNIQFIFFDTHNGLRQKLEKRWESNNLQIRKISTFLNKVSYRDFINLLNKLDLMLDPLYFGSGTVFYQSISVGLPVVTMSTRYLKGMVATGGYRQMGINNPPIAKNKAEYLDICRKLIRSKDERTKLKDEILLHSEINLFDHEDSLYEYEIFIRDAVKSSRSGKKLSVEWQSIAP